MAPKCVAERDGGRGDRNIQLVKSPDMKQNTLFTRKLWVALSATSGVSGLALISQSIKCAAVTILHNLDCDCSY